MESLNMKNDIGERFDALLEKGDLGGLEEAWMEALSGLGEEGQPDLQPFLTAAEALVGRGEKERGSMLLELLLPASERAGPRGRLEVLRRLLLAQPRRRDLRSSFADCYKEAYAGDQLAEIYLSIADVEGSPEPQKALPLLDRLLAFKPGSCVYHGSGWGVGVVESIDPVLRSAVVDLEKKRHHRVDLKAIAGILEPLPEDHFLALGRDGGAALRAMAESDPVALVGIVVQSFGNPQELKSIKARLIPDIIPTDGWSRWWNRTKGLLRDSGFYRVADRAPFTIERLNKSVSYEDELLRQFEAGGWPQKLEVARRAFPPAGRPASPAAAGKARKAGRPSGGYPRLRERAMSDLRSLTASEKGARAVEAAAVLERIAAGEPWVETTVLQAMQAAPDAVEAILGIEGADERRRAVQVLPEALGASWPEAALVLLTRGDDVVRDELALLLGPSPALPKAAALVTEAVRTPRNSPDLFAWACRSYLNKSDSPLFEPLRTCPAVELLGRVFDALDNLGMRGERDGKAAVRDTVGKVRALLADESRFFLEVIRPLPRDEARGIYQRVLSSGGLSEPLRVKLLEHLMATFPDITRAEVRPIWEEDAIYVTEGGLSKKQAEFRELTEEKLPRNFQDIGRAAAFGDLSENAEYTSALEERDRLTKRATEIKAQLDQVKLITPEMLKAGEVCLGARVKLVNVTTGHPVTYSILGPWDGGPEDGVLNYRSPLAITLLGKGVGDEVEAQLPGGTERFRVVEVGSAFEPPSGKDSIRR